MGVNGVTQTQQRHGSTTNFQFNSHTDYQNIIWEEWHSIYLGFISGIYRHELLWLLPTSPNWVIINLDYDVPCRLLFTKNHTIETDFIENRRNWFIYINDIARIARETQIVTCNSQVLVFLPISIHWSTLIDHLNSFIFYIPIPNDPWFRNFKFKLKGSLMHCKKIFAFSKESIWNI